MKSYSAFFPLPFSSACPAGASPAVPPRRDGSPKCSLNSMEKSIRSSFDTAYRICAWGAFAKHPFGIANHPFGIAKHPFGTCAPTPSRRHESSGSVQGAPPRAPMPPIHFPEGIEFFACPDIWVHYTLFTVHHLTLSRQCY
jgi:hypothetical protein